MAERGPDLNQFRDILYESLAGGGSVRDADPLSLLRRLSNNPPVALANDPLLTAVQQVVAADSLELAVRAARQRFETPARFQDAIYFTRCLAHDPAATQRLLHSRRYLEEASVPASQANLHTDRLALVAEAGFAVLWNNPQALGWMLGAIDIWKRDYITAYLRQHASFNAVSAAIAAESDEAALEAAALAGLNRLRPLGPPLALASLEHYDQLSRIFDCPVSEADLTVVLSQQPVCQLCGLKLSDTAPLAEARRTFQAIRRGLATQNTRIARRVAARVLSRGASDQIEQFLKVVQSSDLSGLANVLDEDLLAFLQSFLAEDQTRPSLLDRLASAYPEINHQNLDEAVNGFRRLLLEDLSRGGALSLKGNQG